MTRKFIVSGIFAAVAAAMSAVPASDSPMLRTLPDGTSIEIMLHGDENFHYATLLDGSIVKQGDDGYFYYAEVTADGIVATPYKVGDNVPKQRVVKSTGVKNRLRALRSQALQRRAVKPHAAQRSASDINSQHGLVILVDYPDMPMVQTNKDYSEMLNSEGTQKIMPPAAPLTISGIHRMENILRCLMCSAPTRCRTNTAIMARTMHRATIPMCRR